MRKKTAYGFMLGITVVTVGAMLWVPGERARPVRAEQVTLRRMEERVDGGGLIGRIGEHTVSSLSGGVIAQVFVEPKQQVEKNQALFRLDTSVQEQALSALLRAQDRGQALQGAPLEDAATVWEDGAQWLTEAQREENRRQAEQLEVQIAAMTVRAQEAGEVLSTYIRAGEVLLPGVPALTLAQDAQVIHMQVGERESLRLREGMRARLLRDDVSLGGAVVTTVGLPQTRQDGVLTVAVELRPDQTIPLPVGARLDVEIICKEQEQALLLPLEAIDESTQSVWQVYKQRAWQVPVEVGLQDALHAAVQGLAGDAWVIVQPPSDLQEGELVEVMAP